MQLTLTKVVDVRKNHLKWHLQKFWFEFLTNARSLSHKKTKWWFLVTNAIKMFEAVEAHLCICNFFLLWCGTRGPILLYIKKLRLQWRKYRFSHYLSGLIPCKTLRESRFSHSYIRVKKFPISHCWRGKKVRIFGKHETATFFMRKGFMLQNCN